MKWLTQLFAEQSFVGSSPIRASSMERDVRFKSLETYKKFNKFTLAGSLLVALFVPTLTAVALGMAAVDGVQIVAIDKFNKKKQEGR